MNISDFFQISHFTKILDTFGRINLPSKIELSEEDGLKLVVDTSINKNNDLVFAFNFYDKNKSVNISSLNNNAVLVFLEKFALYIQNFMPLQDDIKRSKFRILLKRSRLSLTLIKRIIKETDIHSKILFLYLNKSLNMYTVNGYNNVSSCRTIIRSFDRINIVSNEIAENDKLHLLTNLHKLNVTLLNYVLQNNLLFFFSGLLAVITVVRVIILIAWVISNIAIFSVNGFLTLEPGIILNVPALNVILNIVFSAIWFLSPKLIVSLIKLRLGINRT